MKRAEKRNWICFSGYVYRQLEIDAKFITDLDSIFEGKLRQSVSLDKRCQSILDKNGHKNLIEFIGDIDQIIDKNIFYLKQFTPMNDNSQNHFFLSKFISKSPLDEKERNYLRKCFIIGMYRIDRTIIPIESYELLKASIQIVIDAFRGANVFVLPKGELEHHLPSFVGDIYNVTEDSKKKAFEYEREFLLSKSSYKKTDIEEINKRYFDLVPILNATIPSIEIDLVRHVELRIQSWIFEIQRLYSIGEIKNTKSIYENVSLDWKNYQTFIGKIDFVSDNKKFKCKIYLKNVFDGSNYFCEFNEKIHPLECKVLPVTNLNTDNRL